MDKTNCKSTLKYIICNAIVELCRQEAFYINELKIEGTICIVSDRSSAMIFQITEEIGDKNCLSENNTMGDSLHLYSVIQDSINEDSSIDKVNDRHLAELFESNHKATEINQEQINSIEKKDGQYNCPMCPKSYNFKHSLRDHLNKHTGLRPHHCKHCSLQFSHLSSLCAHIKKNHSEIVIGDFKCDVCSQAFTTEQFLRQHITWKHTLNRKTKAQKTLSFNNDESIVSLCKTNTTLIKTQPNHKDFSSIKSEPENCEEENLATVSLPSEIEGLQSQSWFNFTQFAAQDPVTANNYFSNGNGAVSMDFNRMNVDQSWLVQQNVDLQPTWSSVDSKSPKKKFTSQNRFQCPYCEKNYNSKYTLKEHMNKHTGCRPNVCKHCGDTFIHLASLCAHIKRAHDEHMPTEFACKICNEKLMNPQSLKQHHTWRHKDVLREPSTLPPDRSHDKEAFERSDLLAGIRCMDQNQMHSDMQIKVQSNLQNSLQANIQNDAQTNLIRMSLNSNIQPLFCNPQRPIINFETDYVETNSS